MHAQAKENKRNNLGKDRSSESILKKKGGKNANFPENRGPQERISKTGEDRGPFCKKTRLRKLFWKEGML